MYFVKNKNSSFIKKNIGIVDMSVGYYMNFKILSALDRENETIIGKTIEAIDNKIVMIISHKQIFDEIVDEEILIGRR